MSLSATAQQLVPLGGNARLEHYRAQEDNLPPKGYDRANSLLRGRDCQLEDSDVVYVDANEVVELEVVIDTFGLGLVAGMFECIECDGNPIGEAVVEVEDGNATLLITGAADLLGADYRFIVEFCNPNGCASTSFDVVGRRAPQEYDIAPVILQSEAQIGLDVQASQLPGPLACNKITDVPDDYEGRDKLVYFNNYGAPDSSFVYVASRYAGEDKIDITVCDSFTVCDVYHFSFIIQHDTLRLGESGGQEAFLDDFSYESIVPPTELWLDEDVYINRTFATDQPSLGVATFDGIDRNGRAYNTEGLNDRLTSTYLDLTPFSTNPFLSFWLQPRGLGQAPETDDYMVLEFKESDGTWTIVQEFYPEEMNLNAGSEAFFFSFPILSNFRHKGFQFRFSAYNSGNGIDDIWNLDYVWLSDELATFQSNITDVALTRLPAAFTAPYTSMPWRHFDGRAADFLPGSYNTYLYNLDNDQALNAGAGVLQVVEANTGIQVLQSNLLNACCRTVFSNEGVGYTQDFEGLSAVVDVLGNAAFDAEPRLEFEVEYNLTDVTNEQDGLGYEAVATNNRAVTTTVFDHYFAYDDGSAENGVVVQEGDQVAVKYTATVDDSLQAVQFNFPRIISNVAGQEFHLQVWVGELDDEPEIRMTFERPFYPSSYYDSLQAFTTYPLFGDNGPTAVFIPAGDFYIGWEQVSPCDYLDCIPVGFDRNSPQGKSALFFNNNDQGWEPFPEAFLPGSVMLRPIMGSERPISSGTQPATALALDLRVYPNPARDQAHIRVEGAAWPTDFRMALVNTLGQVILDQPLAPEIELNEFQPGMYLLKVYDPANSQSLYRKLMVTQ